MPNIIPIERIENKIFLIRGQKVMVDRDLAELYGVETFNLNKAVKRNLSRFPVDFMFQLNKNEAENLKFQIGISSKTISKAGWGGRRTLPFVFTEQGVAMLSSVLRSERAIQINILIMRAFVRIKEALATHKEVSKKLVEHEGRLNKHDNQIIAILNAINKMVEPEIKPIKRIGFAVREEK